MSSSASVGSSARGGGDQWRAPSAIRGMQARCSKEALRLGGSAVVWSSERLGFLLAAGPSQQPPPPMENTLTSYLRSLTVLKLIGSHLQDNPTGDIISNPLAEVNNLFLLFSVFD